MALSPIVSTSLGYIDVFSTVSRLMSDRNVQAPALNALSSSYTTRISTYGKVQSALASFQSAAESLTGDAFNAYSASATTAGVASATTSSSSAAGSYSVQVDQLARAQSLASAGQASATAAIGSGGSTTLTFELGTTEGATFTPNAGQTPETVTIDASHNSLYGIASAINDAEIGVSAAVSFDGADYHLTLSGATGAANSMRISVEGDAALAGFLSYDPAGTQTMTQSAAAQNAQAVVDGVTLSSPTNTLVGVIDGTTLELTGVGTTSVTVALDTEGITSKAEDFVKAYNTLTTALDSLALDDPGAMVSILSLRSQLSKTLNATQSALAGAAYTSPAEVGFDTQADGTLALDATDFQDALDSNLANVAKIFTNDGQGIADKFADLAEAQLADGSWISEAVSGLSTSDAIVEDRKLALAFSLTGQTQSLVSQYTATNLALARWQQAGALLSAQFPESGGLVDLFG